MQRSLVWIVLAVLLALGALWLAFPREHAKPEAALAPPTASAPSGVVTSPLEAADSLLRTPSPGQSVAASPARPAALAILVVARETGVPLASIEVRADDEAGESWPQVLDARTGERTETEALTPVSGRVEFEVAPGRALHVRIRSRDLRASELSMRLAPLATGERRDLRFELATREDREFHGLVRDRATRAPIARAALSENGVEFTCTDADGRFHVPYKSWHPRVLDVTAPGYALNIVHAPDEPTSAALPFVVDLDRTAALVVRIVGSDPVSDSRRAVTASVRRRALSTQVNGGDPREEEFERWHVEFDAGMRAEFDALPPNVHIDLLTSSETEWFSRTYEHIVLAPNERRELVWSFAGRPLAMVHAIDEYGAPVAGLELELLHDDLGMPQADGDADRRTSQGLARTDVHGAAEFRDMPGGNWKVCPVVTGNPERDQFAPAEVRFTSGADAEPVRVELHLVRARFLRGIVRAPDGRPLGRVTVVASSDPKQRASVASESDGTFAIGPVAPGMWRVRAQRFRGFAPSAMVEVAAGSEGLELTLRDGLTLRGLVVDAEGKGCAARVQAKSAVANADTQAEDDGTFEIAGLDPGEYALCATTDDARAGIVRCTLVDGRAEPMRIALAPGAQIRCEYAGRQPFVAASAEFDGADTGMRFVMRGGSTMLTVPPGKVRVLRALRPGDWRLLREVTVAAGERCEVAFRDDD